MQHLQKYNSHLPLSTSLVVVQHLSAHRANSKHWEIVEFAYCDFCQTCKRLFLIQSMPRPLISSYKHEDGSSEPDTSRKRTGRANWRFLRARPADLPVSSIFAKEDVDDLRDTRT